MFLITLFPL
ncbi:hypothetical protein LINPERPRIM_LOCUS15525 [Linum perenne]